MKILIIKFGALGDVVMATPLIAAIAQKHRGDEVHLLTTAPYEGIFAACPELEVTVRPRKGLRHMLNTIAWIRRNNFERIYDLQGNDRSGVLCAFSASPIRVGNHPRFPYTHHPRERWRGQSHIFTRMREVIGAAGVTEVGDRPVLPLTAREKDTVIAWLAQNNLGDRGFVVLHAAASAARPEKLWPYFGELGERIIQRGLTPVWIGAAGDAVGNRVLCDSIGGIDTSGLFSINALAELGRHARFAVTNDSGPMHVLAASDIPVFGLFGPSDWRRNHAIGQEAHVISCTDHVSEFRGSGTGDCLDRLSCDIVWDRIAASGVL